MSAKVHENKLKIKFIIYKYKLYTNSFTLTTNKCLRWYAPHVGIAIAWFIVIGLKVTINIAAFLMSPMYLINSPYNIVHTIAVKAVKNSCKYNTNSSVYVLGTGIDHSSLLQLNCIYKAKQVRLLHAKVLYIFIH